MAHAETLIVETADPTGQKVLRAEAVKHETVGALLPRFMAKMELTANDVDGSADAYNGRLEGEGRHLLRSESVGEALRHGDRISLYSDIQAGAKGPVHAR